MGGHSPDVFHQPWNIFKYLMIDPLKQEVFFASVPCLNLIGIVDMSGTVRKVPADVSVDLKLLNYVLYLHAEWNDPKPQIYI